MKTLLRIDASVRVEGSFTRLLADYVENTWTEQNPKGKVIYRNLEQNPVPHLKRNTVQEFGTPQDQMSPALSDATQVSDELITELKQADELLISSPLYNLNVPSGLKAYIDQVTRLGYTFKTDEDGTHQGLLQGKKAYLVLAKGGVYKNTPYEAFDFQEPYLKAILQYMGIEVKTVFSLEGTAHPTVLQSNLTALYQQIDTTFQTQIQLS